jgi:hypothetical protein
MIKLKLTAAGRRLLSHGRLKVTVQGDFTASGGGRPGHHDRYAQAVNQPLYTPRLGRNRQDECLHFFSIDV